MGSALRALALLMCAAIFSVAGSAIAQDSESDAPPAPAPAPGPAYPDIPEVDMTALCPDVLERRPLFYPERALRQEQPGFVLLDCTIGDDGRMQTCQVLQERPRRFGFGRAAIQIACNFHIDPATIVEGEAGRGLPAGTRYYKRQGEGEPWRVRVPTNFRLSGN
ncbi:MAG: TonB family protein [Hyphomonadaceae bacterium]